MEKVKWSEKVTNEKVIERMGEKRTLLNNILHKKSDYQISREKFEPEAGFESRTSGFLARRSTT